MFLQGNEILQVFKNSRGGKKIHIYIYLIKKEKKRKAIKFPNSATNNRSSSNSYPEHIKILLDFPLLYT